MRDTGDMMEDTFSEDTMMECSADDAGLDDLSDLTDDISNSAPTIRDAAERLLKLLGVDSDENDDFSSEDEGVELDEDSDENDEDDDKREEPQNTRLLHQLAISLAQELKYSQKQASKSSSRLSTLSTQRATRNSETLKAHINDPVQCMEVAHDICYQDEAKTSKYDQHLDQTLLPYKISGSREILAASSYDNKDSMLSGKYETETRTRLFDGNNCDEGKTTMIANNSAVKDSWAIGWDACATEAIRYLIEDEGLSTNHPTVLAMKNHLEIQRERNLAQYAA